MESRVRAASEDRQAVARYVVGAFRADVARAGADQASARVAQELCRTSADFARLWRDNEVAAPGEGVKRLLHSQAGWSSWSSRLSRPIAGPSWG